MIKPSKVVFISDDLEKDFNELKDDDPIKKGIIRAIRDLQQNAFQEYKYRKDYSQISTYRSMELTTYGNMIFQMDGDYYTQ